MSDTRRVFLFSFHEHDWVGGIEDAESGEQMMLQIAASQNWEPYKDQGPQIADAHSDIEEFDALVECARQAIVDEYRLSEAVFQLPFEKLRRLMAEGGWEFAGGTFFEFEGNHNDTKIFAVLRKV
jgi:hypothetical protein